MKPVPGCPACGSNVPLAFIEDHHDRVGGKPYKLFRCPACGVVSSEPREAVGSDWYVKAAPIRGCERRATPDKDWRFCRFFSENLLRGKLLDVGCGDGGFLALAVKGGFQAAGFDYDRRAVEMGLKLGLKDIHSMEFSAFCRTRRTGEFDVITMFDVLEHTPEPAWFLGELKRLLKPGGHAVITLPNALRPLPWGREEHDFPPHHFTRWTPDAMRHFLKTQGFSVIRQEAATLRLRYISYNFFFFRVMPGLLALARRILFGRRAKATITELYDKAGASNPGMLSDKRRRQRIINSMLAVFEVVFVPAALVLRFYYTARQRQSGDCLYTLARYEG